MDQCLNKEIYQTVKDCGHLDGYTDAQLLARQVCKLQEELSEVVRDVVLPKTALGNTKGAILAAGLQARQIFDMGSVWEDAGPIPQQGTLARIYMELADCYVALAVIEQTIARMLDTPVDVAQLGLAKTRMDAARGVR